MPPTELVSTRYGPMWVFSGDPGCSGLLKLYGEYSELEMDVMRRYVRVEDTVLDVGAHIGAFTIPLALHAWAGRVLAFEPVAESRELLQRNVDLHHLKNVEIYPFALGHESGKTHYTFNHTTWEGSWGSVGMEPEATEGSTEVEIFTLDSLNLSPNFIKLDVEGMEMHVLIGGQETIARSKPPIFAEYQPDPEAEALQIHLLGKMGYYTAQMALPFYVRNNWRGEPDQHVRVAHLMHLYLPGWERQAVIQ